MISFLYFLKNKKKTRVWTYLRLPSISQLSSFSPYKTGSSPLPVYHLLEKAKNIPLKINSTSDLENYWACVNNFHFLFLELRIANLIYGIYASWFYRYSSPFNLIFNRNSEWWSIEAEVLNNAETDRIAQ